MPRNDRDNAPGARATGNPAGRRVASPSAGAPKGDAKTIEFLKSVKPGEVDGTEEKDISITFPNGNTRQFKGQGLLLGNSLPNFYFHTTTAYDIIRQCGVEVGKRDFMGTPPA